MQLNILLKILCTPVLICSFLSLNAQSGPSGYIAPDHPYIQYTGRIDFSNAGGPRFAHPGVLIKAGFKGTAIDVILDDHGTEGEKGTNFYEVLIDGRHHKTLKINNSDTVYHAASGLKDLNHTIQIFKRTEAGAGATTFKGLVISGDSLIQLPSKPERKIAFIGDSWTAAYGNDTSIAAPPEGNPETGFHARNQNQWNSWGAIVSRRLGAQYHCTAVSGKGVHRNNGGDTTNVLPDLFPRIFPGQASPEWDFSQYQPDLAVIHLGSNDFFPERHEPPDTLDSAAFVQDYIRFIDTVNNKYPDARIVIAFGNSLSDASPAGMNQLTRWRNYTKAIVDHFQQKNDTMIHSFELSRQTPPYGEDWHPNTTTHYEMAGEITPFLQNLMEWQGDTMDCTGKLGGNAYSDECKRCVGANTGLKPCTNATGINKSFAQKDIVVYPNPVPPDTHFMEISGKISHIKWLLKNASGKILRNGKGKRVNTKKLPAGSYILEIRHKDGKLTRKIVKH